MALNASSESRLLNAIAASVEGFHLASAGRNLLHGIVTIVEVHVETVFSRRKVGGWIKPVSNLVDKEASPKKVIDKQSPSRSNTVSFLK
jgi:hypothetical protein